MTWYVWKWWVLAWAAGPGRFNQRYDEAGEEWACLFGRLYVRIKQWNVVIVQVHMNSMPTFYGASDIIKAANVQLKRMGHDPQDGTLRSWYRDMDRNVHVFGWEEKH